MSEPSISELLGLTKKPTFQDIKLQLRDFKRLFLSLEELRRMEG